MALTLYHRTSIAEARAIVERGFEDIPWDFGIQDAQSGDDAVVTGVWLADRPLGEEDGILGAAVVEVTLDLAEEQLEDYELEGLLWNARIWVADAALVNAHATTRILEVDPRSSWWHEAIDPPPES